MDEYIKKEDALEIVRRTSGDYAAAFSEIRKLPTVDAVKVTRCRECKFFTEGIMCKRIPDKPIIPVAYNHYCSYGEKRP